jgi:hypothetical protein
MKDNMSNRPLADMESNGVYFDIDELLLVGDESICQYTGLPSVSSYVGKHEHVVIGHS